MTSAEVWGMLRQESSVELGPITLAGAGPQRKVALDVTIDPVAAVVRVRRGCFAGVGGVACDWGPALALGT